MTAERVILTIRARTKSTRLDAKSLQPLAGKPAIVHIGERARMVKDCVDRAVFCIPDSPDDDRLASVLEEHFGGDPYYAIYRGLEDDPSQRVMGALEKHGADIAVEGLSGDTPLCYMGFLKPALELLKSRDDLDCVWYDNPEHRFTIEHLACHAWPVRMSWWRKTLSLRPDDWDSYREHPTLLFHWNPDRFKIGFVKDSSFFKLCKDAKSRPVEQRWCLDYPEDLVFLGAVFDALYDGEPFPLADAVEYVNAHPHLRALNAAVAESVAVYATPWQRRRWQNARAGWLTPEGCRIVMCSSGSCYLGYVEPIDDGWSPELRRLDGTVLGEAKHLSCNCGAGKRWHRG